MSNALSVVSVKTIAKETGLSRRTVQRALRDLEAEGRIVKRASFVYELTLPSGDA